MILLCDISDYIASLGIARKEHCYHGIMPDKEEESIGTYPQKRGRPPDMVIGGLENKSYETRELSFLVHWNHSPTDTEKAAFNLYHALRDTVNAKVNGHTIAFVKMSHEEPIAVGADEKGVIEYVIECMFYIRAEQIEKEERKG